MKTVKVKRVHQNARLPKDADEFAACADLYCCEDCVVKLGGLTKVRTGLVFEIPEGHMVEVRPRSGVSGRGIIIPNSPGTIDSNYRGEVIVMMYGLFGSESFKAGDRVAQARLIQLEKCKFEEVQEVSETARGSGGFGSTGK